MQRNSPPWIPQLQDPPADPEKVKVGAWLDDPFCPVDQEVRAHLEKVVNELESHGISIDRSARPQIDPEEAAMLGLWLVQRAISQSTDSDGPGHRIWLDRHVRREEIRLKWAKFSTTTTPSLCRSASYRLLSINKMVTLRTEPLSVMAKHGTMLILLNGQQWSGWLIYHRQCRRQV